MTYLALGAAAGILIKYVIPAAIAYLGGRFGAKKTEDINEANIEQQNKVNLQNRQWNIEDYQRQLRDSSPKFQMQRLKEAGLNPNLIYGKINPAIPTVKSQSAQAVKQEVPDYSFLGRMGQNAMETYQRDADVELKKAQAIKTLAEATGKKLDNKVADQLIDDKVTEFRLTKDLKNITVQKGLMEQELLRDTLQYKKDVERDGARIAVQRALQERQKTALTRKQNEELDKKLALLDNKLFIAKWHTELAKKGITQNDSKAWRILVTLLGDYIPKIN